VIETLALEDTDIKSEHIAQSRSLFRRKTQLRRKEVVRKQQKPPNSNTILINTRTLMNSLLYVLSE